MEQEETAIGQQLNSGNTLHINPSQIFSLICKKAKNDSRLRKAASPNTLAQCLIINKRKSFDAGSVEPPATLSNKNEDEES